MPARPVTLLFRASVESRDDGLRFGWRLQHYCGLPGIAGQYLAAGVDQRRGTLAPVPGELRKRMHLVPAIIAQVARYESGKQQRSIAKQAGRDMRK